MKIIVKGLKTYSNTWKINNQKYNLWLKNWGVRHENNEPKKFLYLDPKKKKLSQKLIPLVGKFKQQEY